MYDHKNVNNENCAILNVLKSGTNLIPVCTLDNEMKYCEDLDCNNLDYQATCSLNKRR